MDISQTIIKNVLSYGLCPTKFKAMYMDGEIQSEPTIYMFRGIYFEYELFGNLPKSGETPVYPVGKKGKHEIHKSRIDKQIKNFNAIMKKEGIEVLGGVQNAEFKYSSTINLTITLDSLVFYKDKIYVMDIKLCQDLTSTFGPLAWGAFETMDKIQAHLYSYVMSEILGEPVGFIYAVFDYKNKKQEYKILEVKSTPTERLDMFRRISETQSKILWMRVSGFKPKPYENTCKKCPLIECLARFQPDKKAEVIEPETLKGTESLSMEELMAMLK